MSRRRIQDHGASAARGASLLPLALSLACSPSLGKLGDVAEEELDVPPESLRTEVLRLEDGTLDVLVVIDNSGSMGTEQARLTLAISTFAQEASTLRGLDLRLGFTTTDNGNPWCTGTSPEAGHLLLSSCRGRSTEFEFNGAEVINVFDEACLDICPVEQLSTVPTTTHLDDEPAPRSWIEVSPDASNLGDLDLASAVRCTAPMGINGCGFESPLEVMHLAIDRADSPSDLNHGFLRPWARLAVVFVTDEADCSADDAWQEIFLPDGNRVFWSDPTAPAPTSSVCWNAGVQCMGTAPEVGPCVPQNYDVDGNVTEAANAVMRSLTRYIEDLHAVEASKAAYRPDGSVSVALLAGVPEGYADGSEEIHYTRGAAGDPTFVENFGIDPGCTSEAGEAVPPVRLKALAELFPPAEEAVVHSICAESYAPAFTRLLQDLAPRGGNLAACVPGCLADVDSSAAGTQVSCDVIMGRGTPSGREEVRLSECEDGPPAEGDDACYRLDLDADAAACAPQGSNAWLELVLREGATWRGQLTVEVACEMSSDGC